MKRGNKKGKSIGLCFYSVYNHMKLFWFSNTSKKPETVPKRLSQNEKAWTAWKHVILKIKTVKKKIFKWKNPFNLKYWNIMILNQSKAFWLLFQFLFKFPSISSWHKQFREIEMETRKNSLPPNHCFPTKFDLPLAFSWYLARRLIYLSIFQVCFLFF